MTRAKLSLIHLGWLMLLAGCANYTKPVVATGPATMGERNFEAVMDSADAVLRDYYFRIERVDRRGELGPDAADAAREGLIITEPLTGQQVWEFWRRDAATRYAVTESTLQTIYRQVNVRVQPAAGEVNVYEAVVEANTYRSSRARAELDSVSAAYAMFLTPGGNSAVDALSILGYERTLQGLAGYGADGGQAVGQLVSLGPDAALADELQRRINQRAQKLQGLSTR